MNVGKRLRQLREAQKLSQRDIEERTGIMRPYISRVENGHTTPSVETLAKWAQGLDLELYQIFHDVDAKPGAARGEAGLAPAERELLAAIRSMRERDRRLLLSMARYVARIRGEANEQA